MSHPSTFEHPPAPNQSALGRGLERQILDELFVRSDAFGEWAGNGWITRKEQLTESDVAAHLAGTRTVGLHLRGVDDRCRWGVFDIDAHDSDASNRALELAGRLMKELRRRGVPFIEEDSDGRGGRHLWIRFERPVPYDAATRFGDALKSSAGCGCEYFPKTSSTHGEFAGGFIRLPGRHPSGSGHWSRVRNDGTGEWSTPEASVSQILALSSAPQAAVFGVDRDLPTVPGSVADGEDGVDRDNGVDRGGGVDRDSGVDGEDGGGGDNGVDRDNSVAPSPLSTLSSLSPLSTPPDRHVSGSPMAAGADSSPRRAADPRVRDCIERTQPSAQGQRNKRLFELARHVLSIRADWTPGEREEIARRWWTRAVAVIGTKDFTTTWADFESAYGSVRHPVGATIDQLATEADELPASGFESRFDAEGYRRLIRLILVMDQRLSTAQGEFYLSCRDAGRVANMCHTQAWKFLKLLQSMQALLVVGQPTKYHANRYKLGPALEPDRLRRTVTPLVSVPTDGA